VNVRCLCRDEKKTEFEQNGKTKNERCMYGPDADLVREDITLPYNIIPPPPPPMLCRIYSCGLDVRRMSRYRYYLEYNNNIPR